MRLFPKRKINGSNWCLWRWFDIRKGDDIYLTRLTVLRTPWFQVLLHWINKPDSDHGMHDHPWWFMGFVINGEYIEQRASVHPDGFEHCLRNLSYKTVRFLIWNPKSRAHKINMTHGRVVTLLLTGPKTKSWGFYQQDMSRRAESDKVPVKYTPWREFLQQER